MTSRLTGSEFQIGTTQTINGISTTVSNDNSKVPTSKAVKNFIDNITPVSLTVSGNWSNVQYISEAVDTAGLTFTVTYKGGVTASITPSIRPLVWSDTIGTQAATFYYTEHGVTVSASKSASVVPSQKVGGTIFYIDNTASGSYRFFNAQGQEVSAPTVGTDCTNWTYTIIGTTKDKFYSYYPAVATDKTWGYYSIITGATGDSIGAGKTNTSKVLAITDTSQYASGSIWEHIRNMRTNKANGCDDWFVGCKAEYTQLKSSGTAGASWFSSNSIWTSVEDPESTTGRGAVYWMYQMNRWDTYFKNISISLVPIRAF